MRNIFKRCAMLTVLFVMGLSTMLPAQSIYKLTTTKENSMKLSGTSTRHDWVMNAHVFTGEAHFDFEDGNDKKLNALKLSPGGKQGRDEITLLRIFL